MTDTSAATEATSPTGTDAPTGDAATVTYAQAVHEALEEAMAADDRVFILGEDVGEDEGGGIFTVYAGLGPKFGNERVRTTPISEQAIMGAAIGAAVAGMRPVAEIMLMNFITLAADQLFNHAAKLRYMSGGRTSVPITVRTATGAAGSFGAQHSDMLEAWLAHAAGLNVVVPSTPADAKGLLLSSIFCDDPCVIVDNIPMFFGVTGPPLPPGERVPLGVASVARPGTDVTVISYGKPMLDVHQAAEAVKADGIDVEVVDLRTISPLDTDTVLASVAKTSRAVVVHEAVRPFGVGAEVAAVINEELFGDLDAPVVRVAPGPTPVPFSPPLEAAYLPGVDDIAAAIRTSAGTAGTAGIAGIAGTR